MIAGDKSAVYLKSKDKPIVPPSPNLELTIKQFTPKALKSSNCSNNYIFTMNFIYRFHLYPPKFLFLGDTGTSFSKSGALNIIKPPYLNHIYYQ